MSLSLAQKIIRELPGNAGPFRLMTAKEFALILAIEASERPTTEFLLDALGISHTSLTRSVASLEKRGFVERKQVKQGDKRGRWLELSQKGRRYRARSRKRMEKRSGGDSCGRSDSCVSLAGRVRDLGHRDSDSVLALA